MKITAVNLSKLSLYSLFVTSVASSLWSTSLSAQESEATEEELSVEDEKHIDDPTRILTRFGVGYDGQLTFNGTLGLDETRMLRVQVNEDASEWQLGGSWLFDKGIVNVFMNGHEERNTYSIGTFVPLNKLGFDTGKWQVFPMAGANFVEGKKGNSNSTGAYVGGFVIRPIDEHWSVLGYSGVSVGSSDYLGVWGGVGGSYKITSKQSIRLMASYSEDSYRTDNKLSISYSYEL
ncbi:hypothetical protein [Shewanella sp. UCD-KL12]|uniref:hypothetical protein n=1 Tax=Shewanella sp. UCD-KL12 TaxID=1917163 RepID=UPI0009FAAC9A|nr:hypothetical protein [Shewanella sp. UCD-KL12]